MKRPIETDPFTGVSLHLPATAGLGPADHLVSGEPQDQGTRRL
jgi:hypothetical protein